MARFVCPHCNNMFEVVAEDLGRNVRCPHCQQVLATGAAGASAGPEATQGGPGPGAGGSIVWPGGPMAPGGADAAMSASPGMAPLPAAQPNPHGLWSFLLGLAYWVGSCGASFALAWPYAQQQAGQPIDQVLRRSIEISQEIQANPPMWLTPAHFLLVAIALAGLGLGLYAVTRPGRRKGLAVTGLVLCGLASCCGLADLVGAFFRG